MMKKSELLAPGAVLVVCLGLAVWAWTGDQGVCIKGQTSDFLQKSAAALNDILELGLKLSVGLVAGAAAILVGLRTIALDQNSRPALLAAVVAFTATCFLSVWWRISLSNAWLNECLGLITSPRMQKIFDAAFLSFILGLIASFGLILIVSFAGKRRA
jgi:hypothetical protein